MSTYDDDFTTLEPADRLNYATGVFLDAEDLKAEQTYHRGRLSRVLAYLHGHGTAAGLEVIWEEDKDELAVTAGVAIDRLGRLIEVPRQACMSLTQWLDYQAARVAAFNALPETALPDDGEVVALTADAGKVATGLAHDTDGDGTITASWLVADIYVRFAVCPRGRTPAFAFGPFDAIDATVPHRNRDSYTLSLELRGGDTAPLPNDPWPARDPDEDVETWERRMQRAVLESYRHGSESWRDGALLPDATTQGLSDTSSVFLARIRVPVTVSADGVPSRVLHPDGTRARALVDNHSRRFVYSTGALVHWLGALRGTFRPA